MSSVMHLHADHPRYKKQAATPPTPGIRSDVQRFAWPVSGFFFKGRTWTLQATAVGFLGCHLRSVDDKREQ